jgi:hypothetical protein
VAAKCDSESDLRNTRALSQAQNGPSRGASCWLDRPSLLMIGEHGRLSGEADAETSSTSAKRRKSQTTKAGHGRRHTAPVTVHDDFVIGKRLRARDLLSGR